MKPIDRTQIVELFLEAQDIAAISRRQYKSNLKVFLLWSEDQGMEYWQLRNPDVIRYKEYLQRQGRSSLTVASYMVTIRLFFRWADKNDLAKDITTSIRITKDYRTFKKKSLSLDQSRSFLSQFDRTTLTGKRDYAIANVLLRNGLREIELVRMNIGDIIEHHGTTAIAIQRKGRHDKDVFLPLSEKALDAIQEYLADRHDGWVMDDPMFVSMSNNSKDRRITTTYISSMIKSMMTRAGITGKYYTAHSLRHTCATLLLADGYSEYEVQTFMGHSNFQTTQIYTRQKQMDLIFTKKPTNFFDKVL